jgi:hypothetical protein
MKAKTKEREEVTITANEIITELWKLLNTSPSKTGGLTGSQERHSSCFWRFAAGKSS